MSSPSQASALNARGQTPLHDWFVYTLEPGNLANGGPGQGVVAQVVIDSQSDFRWWGLSSVAAFVVGGAPARFSVILEDASRAIPFMPINVPMNGENFSGSLLAPGGGSFPNPTWLPRPYRIPAGVILNGIFNNREAAAIYVQLALLGFKVPRQ